MNEAQSRTATNPKTIAHICDCCDNMFYIVKEDGFFVCRMLFADGRNEEIGKFKSVGAAFFTMLHQAAIDHFDGSEVLCDDESIKDTRKYYTATALADVLCDQLEGMRKSIDRHERCTLKNPHSKI